VSKIYRPSRIDIKSHPEINESMIQSMIAEDPTIIGLGDLVLKDKERIQPRSGRLDLLLQNPDTNRRYEVEIQLGKTDETHIIRTIEYWDIERKRYPQYDHCAVIIAEDITSRFLNVMSLFNGFIPLIAIQMNAYKFGTEVGLVFTKVLDEMPLGLVEEDEEVAAVTNRDYWLRRGSEATVKIADEILILINKIQPGFSLKYNKFYIGLAKNGQANNFAICRPKKNYMRLEIKLPKSEANDALIEEAGLEEMDYDNRWGTYRLRLNVGDVKKHEVFLVQILSQAEMQFNG
jgi:hypothetical protein